MESGDNDAILWLSACVLDENDSSSKQPKPLPLKSGAEKIWLFFRNRPNEAKENLFLPQRPRTGGRGSRLGFILGIYTNIGPSSTVIPRCLLVK